MAVFIILPINILLSQTEQEEEYETIESDSCEMCHDKSQQGTLIAADLSRSIHAGLECLDCHKYKNTIPHRELPPGFKLGCAGCRDCHEEAFKDYTGHGRLLKEECEDIPFCSDCHGYHDILPSLVKDSKTHPANLPQTCGRCHEDVNLTRKYEILIDRPIQIYKNSVHGQASMGGIDVAATCNDCHSSGGTAHKIYSPGFPDSTINHFNIPYTCGKCHQGIENDFWEGIHGKLVARGETDAPVCTDCHGEHGILSPGDPRSPVSKSKVAEMTCSPCHESIALTEKYGLPSGRLTTFIDSYHGLKSKSGDLFVANCASCHGVHRILPSTDPTSTVHPDNLQHTCGGCHPGISAELASTPIHGISGQGLQTKAAGIIKNIYIIAIFVIIGLMALHCFLDLFRHIINLMKKNQVRRMRLSELWQHHLLMVSFIVLVITGFALRFDDTWFASFLFGWERGFAVRGLIHRIAGCVLIFTTLWHIIYLITRRGRSFLKDMMPKLSDFKEFSQQIFFYLGRRKKTPCFKRFSYVEKVEYWALIWGTAVMVITGILLWFDNFFIGFLPKGFLDIALVIHFYEAILASLAILIWHLYATIFNPKVYPMNPAWLTGKMPKGMYEHEHPLAEVEQD